VTGEEVEPHPPTVDPATGVLVFPTLADAERKKQKAWNQGDAKARTKILHLLDESHFAQFRDCRTAQELWDSIKRTFEDSSTQNLLLWWTELTQTRLEEDSALQPHLDLILEAARKLAGAAFTVPQTLLVMVLLVSLPPSYATVVTSLHTTITALTPSDRARTLTFKFVSDRLLEYEKMQKLQLVDGTALVVKKKSKGKQSKKSTRRLLC